jgi:uncharacterized membrane protein
MPCGEEQTMASPPWLEELREQLKQQALPPQYLERLLQELSDHFHDIQEEKRSMEAEKVCDPNARMGEPSDLAEFIGSEYRKRYFSQKHPVVMFAVMPVLLLLGIWAGLVLLTFLIGSVIGEATEPVVDGFTGQLICYGSIWLPVALTAVICCRAARHGRVNWRWSLLTAATLAVFPGMTVSLTPSMLMIGFLPPITPAAFIQLILPLAIGGWSSWRGYRLQRS